MEYEIKALYEVSMTKELSLDWNGHNFLVIFGEHINGWFIAIPNWQICTEAGHPTDTFYNTEKLSMVIDIPNAPKAIACALEEYWESTNRG